MDDLRTRAHLVDFDRAGAIGTVVARTEIAEAAAGTEFPATLLLELDRVESGGEATQARVAVDWDQETLEQLLASIDDPEIELWFDEGELAMAFDDVEGHGLREKAAVLAVGVVAAGASATPAFARIAAEPGGRAGSVAPTTAVAPNPAGDKRAVLRGAETALQQDRGAVPKPQRRSDDGELPRILPATSERSLREPRRRSSRTETCLRTSALDSPRSRRPAAARCRRASSPAPLPAEHCSSPPRDSAPRAGARRPRGRPEATSVRRCEAPLAGRFRVRPYSSPPPTSSTTVLRSVMSSIV